ncbi:hypothetical protein B0H13DRAFT_1879407 [Mycena leptocephala]|nr:hypothetical protein B0H13DRAFT_1879407 [Mycena leptocephala]
MTAGVLKSGGMTNLSDRRKLYVRVVGSIEDLEGPERSGAGRETTPSMQGVAPIGDLRLENRENSALRQLLVFPETFWFSLLLAPNSQRKIVSQQSHAGEVCAPHCPPTSLSDASYLSLNVRPHIRARGADSYYRTVETRNVKISTFVYEASTHAEEALVDYGDCSYSALVIGKEGKSGIPKPKLKLKLKASDYWRTWISDLVEVWLKIPVLMQTLVVNDAALSP